MREIQQDFQTIVSTLAFTLSETGYHQRVLNKELIWSCFSEIKILCWWLMYLEIRRFKTRSM